MPGKVGAIGRRAFRDARRLVAPFRELLRLVSFTPLQLVPFERQLS